MKQTTTSITFNFLTFQKLNLHMMTNYQTISITFQQTNPSLMLTHIHCNAYIFWFQRRYITNILYQTINLCTIFTSKSSLITSANGTSMCNIATHFLTYKFCIISAILSYHEISIAENWMRIIFTLFSSQVFFLQYYVGKISR